MSCVESSQHSSRASASSLQALVGPQGGDRLKVISCLKALNESTPAQRGSHFNAWTTLLRVDWGLPSRLRFKVFRQSTVRFRSVFANLCFDSVFRTTARDLLAIAGTR